MIEAATVTREELAHVLDLQDRAYETLLWLSNVAHARPHMLTERTADALRDAATCRAWVAQHHGQLPERLRPAGDEAEAFARLFASFFQTSFRVERRLHDGRPYYVIAANKDEAAGRRRLDARKVPRKLRRKRNDEADKLKRRALATLDDTGADALWDAAGVVAEDADLAQDVLTWTYAVELVERARTGSPGPAVHTLWRQMDAGWRKHLNVDRVWHARGRLVQALRDAAISSVHCPLSPCGTPKATAML